MSYRRLSLPLTVCALTLYLTISSACVRARRGEAPAPLIPMVAPIPVAPAPMVAAPIAPPVPHAPPPREPSGRPSVSPLSRFARACGLAGVAEPVPAVSLLPHVVLVDELPYRWSHEKTKDVSEHAPRTGGKRRSRGGHSFHPAPGIVVDVTQAQGGIGAAEIQRTARNLGYWPFRHCYEEGLRRDQGLAGHVSADLTLGASGAVEHARIASATLHDESVVLCVLREASHLPLSSGGPPTNAKMDITLSTGDGPVPVPRPVERAGELREALRASWPAVEQCYASGLAKHSDMGGRLELRFRTRTDGEIVEVAEEGETRFADVDVTRCVLGVYRTSKLSSGVCSPPETSFGYAMHFEAVP